jgi:hypothetical protein
VIDEALKRYRAQSHGCPTQKAAPTFAGRHNPEDVRKCLLSLAEEKNPSSIVRHASCRLKLCAAKRAVGITRRNRPYSFSPELYSFAVYFTLFIVRLSFNSLAFAPASSIVENSTIRPSCFSHHKPEPSSRAGDLSHKILYI